ncbi:hypothetical protein TWF696_009025 [Orbilia brochopaga]|uniref:ArfGap-domain-containing protein n=1 Tax=Orbilia brochopaga TaxID=3140254 RepID=A0AAV9UHI9_9PEZI
MSSAVSKRQQQRNEKLLQELIAKVPGNNQCADCRSRNPGWASWSLGIFLCMRCAAIHRKLGTHISKVKSISLDTWTNEQVEMMKKTGNVASNAVWNPDPLKHPPPVDIDDSESIMERWIRDKYEHGKFRRDAPQNGSRLLAPSGNSSSKREPSPKPRTRSWSPFESKGSKILGLTGTGSVSIPPEYEAKVEKLKDMGFGDEKQNAQVLKHTKGNMEKAVEILISMGGGTTSPVPPPKDRPVVKKQKSGLMLGGVKAAKSSGEDPFNQLDKQEAVQQQQQQQPQPQPVQQQQLTPPQIHAPQPQQQQQLLVNGQNGIIQNGVVQNGLSPAAYNPFLQPQTTGYQQQQQAQVYMNGNGQWAQNPYQQAMLQQQQQQQFTQPQQSIVTPLPSPWGDVAPPQPQYATSHYTGSSSQSPVSATNPFFATPANPFLAQQQQQPQQPQQPFQQSISPPLQQQHTNGALPVLFQQPAQPPFQDPNQLYLQQQQQQQLAAAQYQQNGGLAPAQALMPQLTGRADKSTILQLYNYPQLAPTPSSVQQTLPGGGLPVQQRSVSTPAFPSSGSNNPFAAKMNSGVSQTAAAEAYQKPRAGSARGHMTQESVDFVALQSGRHSPDAFASLSASYRYR